MGSGPTPEFRAAAVTETMKNLGWSLQFLALVIVGSALILGLSFESMAAELILLGVGILVFMLGKRMQESD